MSGFTKVLGVAVDSITKIMGILPQNMEKIIGVAPADDGSGEGGGGDAGSGGLEENAGATFFGNASLSNGVLQLDGNGDYISIPSSIDYDRGSGDMTVEAWFNAAQLPSADSNFAIVMKGTGAHAWGGWVITLSTQKDDSNSFMTNGGIGIFNNSTGTGGANRNNRAAPSGGVSTNTWHYVVLVMDADNVYRIYFDGQEIHTFTPFSRSTTTSSSLLIGATRTTAPAARFFNGQIDGVKITKSALTAQNILDTWNGGR